MITKIEPSKTNKKAAIVCLGTRIALDSINVRSVGFVYMREYILNVLKRDQVDFISKKSKKEENLDYYKDTKTTDFNDYDEIYIYNAPFNPFGGVFKDEALDTFEKLYSYNGDIIYFLVDPKMPAMDFSTFLKSRDKNSSYTIKTDNPNLKDGRYIDPEIMDNWREKVWKRMKVAYGGIDYEKYLKGWNDKHKNSKRKFDILNEDVEWFNLWLFEYYSVNEEYDLKLVNYNKIDNPYELVYYGNDRHNERNKIIKNYYDIPEFKKLFIGFDPQLENTDLLKYVKHEELYKILGEKCLCAMVVGDILHEGNERTPRFFEAMMLDVVGFIWDKFDPDKNYVKNEFLRDFIYISTKEELKEKINKVKNDPELYKKIVDLERKEIIDQFGFYKV